MSTDEEIAAENRRLEQLKICIDGAVREIREGQVHGERLETMIVRLRREAERLFPEQGRLFDLIYRPRLERAAREQVGGEARDREGV